MKWPETLTVVRHGESAYNALKEAKAQDELYQEFKQDFDAGDYERARFLAEAIIRDGSLTLDAGDHDTPLSDKGHEQSEATGRELADLIDVPDVVFVSPYLRTHQTLDSISDGWPQLRKVKVVEEERLREQEHGLSLIYNDWRIFQAMHPEQRMLYDIEGSYWYRYPQGENVPDVRDRERSWKGALTRDYQGQNVFAVTHHLLILALRANQERFGVDEFKRLDDEEKPLNCGVTIYRGEPELGEDGRLLLDIYNKKLY